MKTVVVGGQSREIGKTSVVAGIVAALPQMGWTAVKVTQYGHGICSNTGEPCACSIVTPDCPYAIEEERNAAGRSDTSRFLRAGARRSLWLRTPIGGLAAALPALDQALAGTEFAILESNSILEHWQPDLYLAVLDASVTDCKDSLRRFIDRADAFLVMGDATPAGLPAKPVYHAQPGVWLTPEVVSFVRHHLEN